MPRISWDKKYKSSSIFDRNQLRLKKGERARIAILDDGPTLVRGHYIKGSDETDKSIKGRYVCLGDEAVLDANGKDPENCPACRVAEPGYDAAVSVQQRRYAINIFRYATRTDGKPINPKVAPQGSHEYWVFGNDKMNALLELSEEHGDLRRKDLILVLDPKKDENFQSMDIIIGSGKPWFLQYDETKAAYNDARAQMLREADLERLIARTVSAAQLAKILDDSLPTVGDSDLEIDEPTLADLQQVLQPTDDPSADDDLPLSEDDAVADFEEMLKGH